jgi:hypothetical protein
MSTDTGLSVLEKSNYLALRPSSDIAEALEANLANGERIKETDLTRVKIPGSGLTRWTIPGITGDETVDEIVGVLVHYSPRGVLWPSEDVGNALPVLVSDDLRTARRVSEEIGDLDSEILDAMMIDDEGRAYDWRGSDENGPNKYNDFGTGKKGIGKRCKESRMLGILRESDAFPLLISAAPGSLKTVVPFVKKLTVPHFRAVVSLKLEKLKSKGGQDYARIIPTLVGELSREEGTRIKQLYTDPLRAVVANIVPDQREYDDEE